MLTQSGGKLLAQKRAIVRPSHARRLKLFKQVQVSDGAARRLEECFEEMITLHRWPSASVAPSQTWVMTSPKVLLNSWSGIPAKYQSHPALP